jgi:hypothetical protein
MSQYDEDGYKTSHKFNDKFYVQRDSKMSFWQHYWTKWTPLEYVCTVEKQLLSWNRLADNLL